MNHKKLLISLVGFFGLSIGLLVTHTHQAYAATMPTADDIRSTQISWTDRDHVSAVIAGTTYTFTDSNLADGTHGYDIDKSYSCYGHISVPNINNPGQVKFDMDTIPPGGASTKCQNVDGANGNNFTASNTDAANIIYYWKDANTLTRADGDKGSDWTFTKSQYTNADTGQTVYLRSSENGKSCQDRLLVSGDGQTASLWVLDPNKSFTGSLLSKSGYMGKLSDAQRSNLGLSTENSTCYYFGTAAGTVIDSGVSMPLGAPENRDGAGSQVPGGGAGGSDSGGDNNNQLIDCGGGSLDWLVCPVLSWAQDGAEKLDTGISSTLNININDTFSSGYYTAWNSFRILATALLIIAGLIMIASQALGFEFLDAYTIRKVLPRLILAVIGISLSWPLMKFVVGLFNTLGQDTYGLIIGPFAGLHAHLNGTTIDLSGIFGVILAGGAFFIYGPAAFLFLVGIFLTLLFAFIVLIIRQIAVVAIIILAPIALVCYILPNTQRVWDLWRENFLGLMVMYPIIMAMIAAGHAFAVITLSGGS